MDEATKIFTEVFCNVGRGIGQIGSFRYYALAALDVITPAILEDAATQLRSWEITGKLDSWFHGGRPSREAAMAEKGGLWGTAQEMTVRNVADFRRVVDAACLVLAHAMIDAAAYDCCRIVSNVSPKALERFVDEKQVPLKVAREGAYEELLANALQKFLGQLEKDSLLRKLDILHTVCKPDAGQVLVDGFTYDRERIEKLDSLRHDVAHGRHVKCPLPNGDADLEYLHGACAYVIALVHMRYDVRVDDDYLAKVISG